MSNYVYPVLAGLGWSVSKTPQWSTKIQIATSGKELRSAWYSTPKYNFKLTYELLRAGASFLELQNLLGFFNSRQGSFDSFLFDDVTDDSVTSQLFGTADGVTSTYQLVRTIGSNVEPTMNINTIASIYDGASLIPQGAGAGKYTVDSYGNVTFGTTPSSGHLLTWTGTYYYRCRFLKDENEFQNFMYQLWNSKQVEFIGCLGNKI